MEHGREQFRGMGEKRKEESQHKQILFGNATVKPNMCMLFKMYFN